MTTTTNTMITKAVALLTAVRRQRWQRAGAGESAAEAGSTAAEAAATRQWRRWQRGDGGAVAVRPRSGVGGGGGGRWRQQRGGRRGGGSAAAAAVAVAATAWWRRPAWRRRWQLGGSLTLDVVAALREAWRQRGGGNGSAAAVAAALRWRATWQWRWQLGGSSLMAVHTWQWHICAAADAQPFLNKVFQFGIDCLILHM
jgi:hypothetical protein